MCSIHYYKYIMLLGTVLHKRQICQLYVFNETKPKRRETITHYLPDLSFFKPYPFFLLISTQKKKVKSSVNAGKVIIPDQLDLIEAALIVQCVIVICKRCQSGGDVKKIITKLYNTATKTAVLTEALEGRMKGVAIELQKTKAQLDKIKAASPVMQDEELQKLKEEVEVTFRKSFADTVKIGGGSGIIHCQPRSGIR